MIRRLALALPLSLTLAACGQPGGDPPSGDQGAVPDAGAADALADGGRAADAGGAFTLTVTNGHGSGAYRAGETVHVWSAHDPGAAVLVAWEGGAGLVEDEDEWHTSLTMPARDVTLVAKTRPVSVTLKKAQFQGVARVKPLRYFVPQAPRGLVLFFHGTGGSGAAIEKVEAFQVALAAVDRGYGVAAFDAEEVQAGDTNGDGKIRWQTQVATPSANPDVQNVKLLITWFRDQGLIGATTPVYAMGMSNGGAFSISLGAVLPLRAVASYCASGLAAVAQLTTTPSAWLMCEGDTNPQVSNAEAKQNHDALVARGVPALHRVHPPSPLYDLRFTRVRGVDEARSRTIAGELRGAKLVDAGGLFVQTADQIAAAVQAAPADYPSLSMLAGAQALEVLAQIEVMSADHQMYADYAAGTLDFFDAHP